MTNKPTPISLTVHVNQQGVDSVEKKLARMHQLLTEAKALMVEINALADELISKDVNLSVDIEH